MCEVKNVTSENDAAKTKAELNSEFSLTVKETFNPLTDTKMQPTYNAELFDFLESNPDAFLRKSKFDGLGEWVKTEELEGKTAYLYACEILDYTAKDPKTQQQKHYHYSVWLGVREEDGLAFIYAAGKKLTGLAEKLLDPANEKILSAVNTKGAHVRFPQMKRLANGNNFMDPDLIP